MSSSKDGQTVHKQLNVLPMVQTVNEFRGYIWAPPGE